MKSKKTAVLFDGDFYLRCYKQKFKELSNAEKVAKAVCSTGFHYAKANNRELYRIFFYDCFPSEKKVHLPISKQVFEFSNSKMYKFRIELFEKLKQTRKVALRLGKLRDGNKWIIKPDIMEKVIKGETKIIDLTDSSFTYDFRQKGVDIKIGIDIVSLAYKGLIDQIVLVSGDADFVPALKLARCEGIDVILQPMGQHINPSLFEHIDGLGVKKIKANKQSFKEKGENTSNRDSSKFYTHSDKQ